ncbi:hypothetical protein [Halospeciosus flavus]|uniref:Uncharacterized protein n=1 Tax=Halospeciosus flavus TaxID=3032283 RepID=A0ABD5Z5L4_9EURY
MDTSTEEPPNPLLPFLAVGVVLAAVAVLRSSRTPLLATGGWMIFVGLVGYAKGLHSVIVPAVVTVPMYLTFAAITAEPLTGFGALLWGLALYGVLVVGQRLVANATFERGDV